MKWLDNQIRKVLTEDILSKNYDLLVELNDNIKNLVDTSNLSDKDLLKENIELKKKLAKLEE